MKRRNSLSLKVVPLFMALLVMLGILYAESVTANAVSGPNPSNQAGIEVGFTHFDDSEIMYLGNSKNMTATFEGFKYNKSNNTLTLDNIGTDEYYGLSIYDMGDDFKINVKGKNSLGYLDVYSNVNDRMNLTITGTGTLTINSDGAYGAAIHGYANGKSNTKITIDNTVNLNLHGGYNMFEGKNEKVIEVIGAKSSKQSDVFKIGGKKKGSTKVSKKKSKKGYNYKYGGTKLIIKKSGKSFLKSTSSSGTTKVRTDLSKASITVGSATYNGKARKPSVSVKLKNKTLKKGTDYTVSYSNNVNAGKKAVVKIKGKGNYIGSATKKFTIKKCSMSKKYISAKVSKSSFEYTGKEIKPSITVYFNGKTKLKKGTDYKVSYLYNKNIGKAYVMITGKGNFESKGRLFGFKITKAKQPLKLSSGNISKRYKDLGSSTTVTVSGIKERAGLTVSSSNDKVATVKKAGDGYKIYYRNAGNAKITFKTNKETKHYKVTSKTIKITVVDDRSTPKITLPKNSYSVLINSATFNLGASTDSDGALSYTSSDNSIAKVDGAGNVTICGKVGSAAIAVSAKGTMKNKPVSATVTINVVDKTKGEQIVEYAKNYLGYPYKINTHGPNSFDCSGFVYYVFKEKFGIQLSYGSSDYWNNPEAFGTVVSESEALPGDVVSWSGHVGIYIGNGQVINALNPSSGVCIINVNAYCNSSGTQNPPHKYIRIRGL